MPRKNPAAVSLGRRGGKKRWEDTTPEERSAYAAKIGSMPKSDAPRCPCGKMTAARAQARGHRCGENQ